MFSHLYVSGDVYGELIFDLIINRFSVNCIAVQQFVYESRDFVAPVRTLTSSQVERRVERNSAERVEMLAIVVDGAAIGAVVFIAQKFFRQINMPPIKLMIRLDGFEPFAYTGFTGIDFLSSSDKTNEDAPIPLVHIP